MPLKLGTRDTTFEDLRIDAEHIPLDSKSVLEHSEDEFDNIDNNIDTVDSNSHSDQEDNLAVSLIQ